MGRLGLQLRTLNTHIYGIVSGILSGWLVGCLGLQRRALNTHIYGTDHDEHQYIYGIDTIGVVKGSLHYMYPSNTLK